VIFPSVDVFIRATLNGLMMGCIFAIIAVGFQLIFGVVKLPQFGHGSVIVWGMYATWYLTETAGLDPFASLLVTLPAFFLLGYLLHRFLFSHVMDLDEMQQMIFMLGFLIATLHLAELVFTANPRILGKEQYVEQPVFLGAISVHRGLAISAVLSVVFLVVTSVCLNRSRLGITIRACADNRYGARVVGLDVRFVYKVAVAIATLLGSAAGAMLMTFSVAAPWRAFSLTMTAFLVIVLGGVGSYVGALVGGIIFGVFMSWVQVSRFSTYSEAILYGFMFVFLLIRPRGLFGRE
jgi:branched-chain amino acid transport system permease protein